MVFYVPIPRPPPLDHRGSLLCFLQSIAWLPVLLMSWDVPFQTPYSRSLGTFCTLPPWYLLLHPLLLHPPDLSIHLHPLKLGTCFYIMSPVSPATPTLLGTCHLLPHPASWVSPSFNLPTISRHHLYAVPLYPVLLLIHTIPIPSPSTNFILHQPAPIIHILASSLLGLLHHSLLSVGVVLVMGM